VTLRAGRYLARGGHLVRIQKREAGGAVVEHACRPSCDWMACRAG
jgi:hypothetical protein